MADQFIEITYSGNKVQVTLKARTQAYQKITLTWETHSGLTAELLAERLERIFGDAIKAERALFYESGYKDGRRDAKSHRPPTKINWFSRVF